MSRREQQGHKLRTIAQVQFLFIRSNEVGWLNMEQRKKEAGREHGETFVTQRSEHAGDAAQTLRLRPKAPTDPWKVPGWSHRPPRQTGFVSLEDAEDGRRERQSRAFLRKGFVCRVTTTRSGA